jgi:hypothetical protein
MNTDRSRRRKPKGAPTGGQFAPESHAESDVSLAAHSDEGIPAAWTATDSAALDTHIRSAEAADRIDACACEGGCPACVGPGSGRTKAHALAALAAVSA